MLRKLKKALPAIVSAILCVTMVLGITASAASAWSETKALTSGRYNSNYIKWVEKYSAKDTKNTITFSKSRTKKFNDKLTAAFDKLGKKDGQVAVSVITKDEILSAAIKGNKAKSVLYIDGNGAAMIMTPDAITTLTVGDKKKVTMTIPDYIDYDELVEESFEEAFSGFDEDMFDLGISENAKGKIFKFKSGENTYYYEEFKIDSRNKVGYLFDSKGNPLAMTNGEISACIKISYTVKDSEFTVPKGYKETDIDDFDLDFGSML